MKSEIFAAVIKLAQKANARFITLSYESGDIYLLLNSGYGFYFTRGNWDKREAIIPESDASAEDVKAAAREAEKEIQAYALKNKYITAEEIDLPF